MNLRTFTAISAVSMLMLGGCIIVDSTGNTGGSAGSAGSGKGGDGTAGTAGTGGMGGTGGSSSSGTAGAGGAMCVGCASFSIDQLGTLCDLSKPLYTAYDDCSCGPTGKCAGACAKSVCATPKLKPDTECEACLTNVDPMKGCSVEVGACSNDI